MHTHAHTRTHVRTHAHAHMKCRIAIKELDMSASDCKVLSRERVWYHSQPISSQTYHYRVSPEMRPVLMDCLFQTALQCQSPDTDPSLTTTAMEMTCPDGHVYGAVCTLSCTHGYRLHGHSSITCEKDNNTQPPAMSWKWLGSEAIQPQCKGSAFRKFRRNG